MNAPAATGTLRASSALKRILWCGYGGALVVLCYTEFPLWLKIIVAIAMLAWLIISLRDARRDDGAALFCNKQYATFSAAQTVYLEGEILAQTLVTPYFILLNLRNSNTRRSARKLICRDQLDADIFRHLCVLLRV